MAQDMPDTERLSPSLDTFLRETNPWWSGKPARPLPPYRRWAFEVLKRKLRNGLAPLVVLRGPRQVGKTTLQEQLVEDCLSREGVEPRRILRVQFDEIPSLPAAPEPILAIARWYQRRILGRTFNEAAHAGEPALIFLDEVQLVPHWAPQLKVLVDHHALRGLVTGSSSLRIEAGRDSLAGRITTVELGPLLVREIAGLRFGEALEPLLAPNGLRRLSDAAFWRDAAESGRRRADIRDRAFQAFAERGGYPVGQANPSASWEELADQLNETVVQRVIRHDLAGGSGAARRDENLTEAVFGLACRYAGQAPGRAILVQEIRQVLGADVTPARVLSYLRLLADALLVKLVAPLELRLKRRRGNDKLCLCDHALRASWLQELIPLTPAALREHPELSDLAGHLAESIAGYFLAGLPHLDVAHFPQRGIEPEVDFVLTVGETRIPVEVKYRQRIDPARDTLGLRAFIEKTVYKASFGVLVTLGDDVEIPDPRIVSISLPSLLLMR
jgi:predicted AAA+ superfamily ATPase